MKRVRRQAKRNPDAVTYWVVLGSIVVGGVAIAAWKAMSDKQRAQALGTGRGVGNPPSPTRSSCLECVDKHLGAALILITETRDGYPHRLRAIGHLHEAEDESQAWPELHQAIREARKRFQQTGATPDFDQLEAISSRMRRLAA